MKQNKKCDKAGTAESSHHAVIPTYSLWMLNVENVIRFPYLAPRELIRSKGQPNVAHLKPLVLQMPSSAAACITTSCPSCSTTRRHWSQECLAHGTVDQKSASRRSMTWRSPVQYLTPCCSPTTSVTFVVWGAKTTTFCPGGGNQCQGSSRSHEPASGGGGLGA